MRICVKKKDVYVRNIIFGMEDSLVSTVGLLSGITVAGASSSIILTGVVFAFVESFSMAIGSFLSEETVEEFDTKMESNSTLPFIGAGIMFISFLLSSLIPVLPYVFLRPAFALWVSIMLSLLALFLVGIIMARLSKIRPLRHGLKMVLLGGTAIIIGTIIGKFIGIQ